MEGRAEVAIDPIGADEADESFATLLHDLGDDPEDIPDLQADPGAALRFIYDGWVKRGGYERGKPRHSARQIKDWLGNDQIRSLETKLAGKTWLQYQDAFNLLRLMLSRWRYDENGNRYDAYVADADLDDLTRTLLQDLFPSGKKALLLPERSRKPDGPRPGDRAPEPSAPVTRERIKTTADAIRGLFRESDALVTISRARVVLGRDPALAMTAFHDLMASLYMIAKQTGRGQIMLWVVEIGLRNNKTAARGAIYNIYFLIAQFRSIALIGRDGREEFYEWLRRNVCMIVGSLTRDEIDRLYRRADVKITGKKTPDNPWFQADRLFVEAIPPRWLDVEGSSAFGKSQKDLWEGPTITAHLRLDGWDLDHSEELDRQRNLRYLFHGEVSSDLSGQEMSGVCCIPLPEPGSRWSDAYRLAIQAAFFRLGHPGGNRLGVIDQSDALGLLRSRGFAVATLDEFLHLADTLVDIDNQFLTKASKDA